MTIQEICRQKINDFRENRLKALKLYFHRRARARRVARLYARIVELIPIMEAMRRNPHVTREEREAMHNLWVNLETRLMWARSRYARCFQPQPQR